MIDAIPHKYRHPTPYPALNTVLQELVSGAQHIFEEDFVGAYLQGSFAVGDFDEHSDVDFLVVIEEEVSPTHLAALQTIHGRIFNLDIPWAQHLEGSYFPRETLANLEPTGELLWYIDNGSRWLIRSNHDNELVVRWMLRERGISLAGPEPVTLLDPIPTDALCREVRATMRTWGQELLADPSRINNRWYQPFVVLSYCRMLQTMQTGGIDSKLAGARWGLAHLDGRWAGLIERAWAERPYPSKKVYQPADSADWQSTLVFIKYAISTAQSILFENR